jgi:acetoin utilization protein AcuB
MFVSMWMTRDVLTTEPGATLLSVAQTMAQRKIRRLPVTETSDAGKTLLGIISSTDIWRAFPRDVNPFALDGKAVTPISGLPASVSEVMTRDPITTTSEAPIEEAARIMRDRKIGGLPVLSNGHLVGLITESDIFRAFVELFEPSGEDGVRITFNISKQEDVFALMTSLASRRHLRVVNFVVLQKHERPMCVVHVTGEAIEELLDDVWKSRHQVVSVIHLEQPQVF